LNNHWYTSDHHFGHKNIIAHNSRPFASVEEMDEALIARWNSVVGPDDVVYHLGDFSFGPQAYYLPRLNGEKHLVQVTMTRGFSTPDGHRSMTYSTSQRRTARGLCFVITPCAHGMDRTTARSIYTAIATEA
jgi:hypothetical protein